MRDQSNRHEQLGLTEAEAAFYDAVVQNDAAVLKMGDDTLKKIAAELRDVRSPERHNRLESQGLRPGRDAG